MNSSRLILMLILFLGLTGCARFEGARKVGTFTYEGQTYDIMSARKEHRDLSGGFIDDDEFVILVRKGTDPSDVNGSVLASCLGSVGDPHCDKVFSYELRRLSDREESDDDGDDY